jgi:hypothetical protein
MLPGTIGYAQGSLTLISQGCVLGGAQAGEQGLLLPAKFYPPWL